MGSITNAAHHQAIGVGDVEGVFRLQRFLHVGFAMNLRRETNGLWGDQVAAQKFPGHPSSHDMLISRGGPAKEIRTPPIVVIQPRLALQLDRPRFGRRTGRVPNTDRRTDGGGSGVGRQEADRGELVRRNLNGSDRGAEIGWPRVESDQLE